MVPVWLLVSCCNIGILFLIFAMVNNEKTKMLFSFASNQCVKYLCMVFSHLIYRQATN